MKWRHEYFAEHDRTVFTLQFDGADLREAEFTEWELTMVRLLEQQQREDPTAEGALMVLQQYVAAIQRGRAICPLNSHPASVHGHRDAN